VIVQSFDIRIRGTLYTIVDRRGIDSAADRDAIKSGIFEELRRHQQDAMCAALGIPEVGEGFDNVLLGVYKDGVLVGGFLLTTLGYQSGPWEDLVQWAETSSDPAVFNARPMPALHSLPDEEQNEVFAAINHHLLTGRMDSVEGHQIKFNKLSWAIFKGRGDEMSLRSRRYHAAIKGDSRFKMTEAPDDSNAELTRVDLETA
jgi:hypothetical protein